MPEIPQKYAHLTWKVKEPLWKKTLRPILNAFEWGDHEYLRGEFGSGLWKGWFTIYEERYRVRGPRRVFPWRIRFRIASVIRSWAWSRCTRCGSAFSWRELNAKNDSLQYFMSGSICHRDCARKESLARLEGPVVGE